MEFEAQLKKGTLELCVLALVAERDRYGYELVESISQYFDVSEGTIYPILRRLTRDNYFEKYLQESSGGPPRKYYRIKPAGLEKLSKLTDQWDKYAGAIYQILNETKRDERNDKTRVPRATRVKIVGAE